VSCIEPALELEALTRTFGALRAVDGVNLRVMPGERRAVIGPNGAGKTTLFNLITGVLPPTGGHVRLLGRNVDRLPVERRIALGLGRTFQITDVFLGLTVEQNVLLAAFGLSRVKFSLFSRVPRDGADVDEVTRLLESLRLAGVKRKLARELSHGEQRQLEVALALAGRPRVLLLDEPMAGLSPAERVVMAELIRHLPADLTVLLIEHDMDIALGLVDRVTCLHYGRVIAEDAAADIRENDLVQQVYLGA